MRVLRRLDAVLEPTKEAVLEMKRPLDKARIANQRDALCEAAGQAFYNTSAFTMRDLASRTSRQQLINATASTIAADDEGRRGAALRLGRRGAPPRGPALRSRRMGRRIQDQDGYEISFTRYFDKPQALRSLEEIRADVAKAQKESEGLLGEILKGEAK